MARDVGRGVTLGYPARADEARKDGFTRALGRATAGSVGGVGLVQAVAAAQENVAATASSVAVVAAGAMYVAAATWRADRAVPREPLSALKHTLAKAAADPLRPESLAALGRYGLSEQKMRQADPGTLQQRLRFAAEHVEAPSVLRGLSKEYAGFGGRFSELNRVANYLAKNQQRQRRNNHADARYDGWVNGRER